MQTSNFLSLLNSISSENPDCIVLYIDEVILQRTIATATDYYFTHDYRYSVTSLTNTAGTIVESYDYKVYGQRTVTGSGSTDFGYTGQRHDSETGLMYFKNRYYSTSMGSFVTRDPLGYVDGLSMYLGYFGGKGVDPMGLIDDQPLQPGRGDSGYQDYRLGIDNSKLKGIIVMGTRPLDNSYGIPNLYHLSLELWTTLCNTPSSSVEYSRATLEEVGARPQKSIELKRESGYKVWKWYHHYSTDYHKWIHEWQEKSVAVSVIRTNELRATTLRVLKIGKYKDIKELWRLIDKYAQQYEFAEYLGSNSLKNVTSFKNWPNSEYIIGSDQINSNTFIYSVLDHFGLNKGNMVSGYNPGKYPPVKIAIDPYFGQKPTSGSLSPKPSDPEMPINYETPTEGDLHIWQKSDL